MNTDFIGWMIWLFGFIIEVIADKQKLAFKNNPMNKVIVRQITMDMELFCLFI
jgi:steroid 5-alpha reductase family enzyme